LKALSDSTYVLENLLLFLDGQTLPQNGLTHISRVDIETKTRKTTETFTIKSICDLTPPLVEIQMNGLYILLSEMNKIMASTMFENPKKTLTLFMKMETKGTLRNTFVSTLGEWYFFPQMNLLLLTHYHYYAP